MIHSWPRASRLGSEQGMEVDGQNVAFDNLHVGLLGEIHAQLRRQHPIDFDCDQPPRPFRQGGSESAAPGADFKHRALRDITQGFHNAHGGRGIHQKVLAQFGPAVDAFPRPRFFVTVDPLSCRLAGA